MKVEGKVIAELLSLHVLIEDVGGCEKGGIFFCGQLSANFIIARKTFNDFAFLLFIFAFAFFLIFVQLT